MASLLVPRVSVLLALLATCSQVQAAQIARTTFTWPSRPGLNIHFASAASPAAAARGAAPLVLLPGFGVGEFHYTAQLAALGDERRTYALDWLGQGKSWPEDEAAERGLIYDAEMWTEQLEMFLETQLGAEPAVLAGNSLGGFLAVQLALKRPDLVRSLVLMNATPFWSFAPPRRAADAWRPFGWDASLPAPGVPYAIGSRWFDTLRSPTTIETMLGTVYADGRAVRDVVHPVHELGAHDDDLVSAVAEAAALAAQHEEHGGKLPEAIASAASRRGGHSAFTSILFSPRTEVSFEDALLRVRSRADAPSVLLACGADDPWVTPLWAERAYRRVALESSSGVAHYSLTPVGHCPHHEAPLLTSELLSRWTAAVDAADSPCASMPQELQRAEAFGRRVAAVRVDGAPHGLIERLAARLDRPSPVSLTRE